MSNRGYLVDRCPRCLAWMRRATPEQHGALQAVLEDIARQLPWPPGSTDLHGVPTWWELLIAAFDRLQKREAVLLPAIDGEGFDGNGMDFVRGPRRRRNVNSVEISEIIEYARAFGVERGVVFREFEQKERRAA
ncbi:MAG: recombination protein NinB [Hyphomicrobiales bacterium]|nr:recombination protein NinB [Hyphomicrobiales bacterium]